MPENEESFDEIERRMNIHRLKNEAAEIAGGELVADETEDIPSEVAEQFWQHVVDYEKAPWTTHWEQLVAGGITPPAPEELDDEEVTLQLWRLIEWLASRRVFLHFTDHLSDRELYSSLWNEQLREPVKDLPPHPDASWNIDMVGSGSEEDIQLSLKYYWDEAEREHWAQSFPEDEIPPHEDHPYARDRHLPQPTYEAIEDDEEWEEDDFDDDFDDLRPFDELDDSEEAK